MLDEFMHLMWEWNPYLSGHSSRVAYYADPLARRLGLDTEKRRRLHIAAHLHDVGKVRVDTAIVDKPGPLDPGEWVEMRRHPVEGFFIIDGLVHPHIAETVLSHHERFDGSGYPLGRSGTGIPHLARILLVADAYDAMTSDRPYQPALSPDHALAELQTHAGTQFDPEVVDAMVAVAEEHRWGTLHLATAV